MDRFWARAARTGIEFETPEQLRAKLVEAVIAARQAHFGGRGLLEHQRHWASALAPLALMSVAGAGADDDARVRLIAAQADVFRHTPLRVEDAELLWQAESGVPDAQPPGGLRHAQAGALLIGRDGLKRLDSAERIERVGRVLAMTARRCGKAFVIGLDIASGDLPASWRPAEMLTLGGAALMAQPEATAASLVQRLHDAGAFARQTQLSVPLLVIAPDDTEAAALAGSAKATLAGFADKDERAQRTRQLRHVAAANRKADAVWPVGYYRATREQWRCFGGAGAADIVAGALKTIRVEGAQLVLRPYALGEFLDDVDGSRRIVRAACEAGALVLIDELALLHPKLSAAADELLARERCAVATVSVVDPAHSPTSALIGGVSYLRVGIVVARFGELRDLQCELHLNSATRLERWLLGAIPRLVADLAGHHPRPTLAQRADELLP